MSESVGELVYTDISDIDLTDEEIVDLSYALPAYFREKIRASFHKGQKTQRLSSGLLLVYLLKCRGIDSAGTDICEGPHGKPEFRDIPGLYFNLSHSADLSLAALAGCEAGCDIQKVKSGAVRIAGRFFTPEENEEIRKAEESDIDKTFTRLWARKESYIKALGEGLSRDLRSFSVLSGEMPDGCHIADYELDDYAAALCLRADKREADVSESFPDLRFIPFQNLVNVL